MSEWMGQPGQRLFTTTHNLFRYLQKMSDNAPSRGFSPSSTRGHPEQICGFEP